MPRLSQSDAMSIPPPLLAATSHSQQIAHGQERFRLPNQDRCRELRSSPNRQDSSSRIFFGTADAGNSRAFSSSGIPISRICSCPSSVFDTHLYSITGLGAYPSPCGARSSASLCALSGFGSSQNKFVPRTAKNAERISFGSLRKSRPSALGSRAHSRGFAMCDPSKFGNSKRRTRNVSEQNHAHRFPRK